MKYLPELGIIGNIQRCLDIISRHNNNLIQTDSNVNSVTESDAKNRADIEYVAMMTDVELEVDSDE